MKPDDIKSHPLVFTESTGEEMDPSETGGKRKTAQFFNSRRGTDDATMQPDELRSSRQRLDRTETRNGRRQSPPAERVNKLTFVILVQSDADVCQSRRNSYPALG